MRPNEWLAWAAVGVLVYVVIRQRSTQSPVGLMQAEFRDDMDWYRSTGSWGDWQT